MNTETEKSRAPAVDKIIKIMDFLASSGQPQTGAEIARALGLPRSSVHVLLAALAQADVLQRLDEHRYSIGMHALHWAGGYLAQQNITTLFYQYLADLPQFDRYTLTLSALEADKVVYLACKNSTAPLGFTFRLGMQAPAVLTATGKFLLSRLTDEEVRARITQFPPAETENSVQNMQDLLAELATVRQRGYAVDNGQLRRGMFCYGVGVSPVASHVQYGIAVSLLEAEMPTLDLVALIQDLQQLAKRLKNAGV